MTNGLDTLSIPGCCEITRGNDLIPLLAVVAVFITAHFARRWWKSRKGKTNMSNMKNAVIVMILVVAVGVVMAIKQNRRAPREEVPPAAAVTSTQPVPRLLDLGATKCIPCKMMAPILEEMKKTYAGRLQVDFIDVLENPEAGQPYGIRVIPTQIFFGAGGKELARHEGFISREDILAKWKELGVNL